MKKSRLSVYLDKPTLDSLSAFAARQNQSLSLVAEAAIAAFVSPGSSGDSLLRRFNRLDRQLQRLERDAHISSEALMVFVWYWFTATPSLPDAALVAARATATERYDAFMETLGQRLAKIAPFVDEVSAANHSRPSSTNDLP